MKVEKSGKKWIVAGGGDGWVLKKKFPTKWKAALALAVWKKGGRVSDYWAAARDEKDRREAIAFGRAVELAQGRLNSARRLYPGGATFDDYELITVKRQPGDWRAIFTHQSTHQGGKLDREFCVTLNAMSSNRT